MTLKLSQYFFTKVQQSAIYHINDSLISTKVNGTMLKFGKSYKDDLWVILYPWPKFHLDLDVLSNQKINQKRWSKKHPNI